MSGIVNTFQNTFFNPANAANPLKLISQRTGNKAAGSLSAFNQTSQEQLYKPAQKFVGTISKGGSVGKAIGAGSEPTKNQVGGWVSDFKGEPDAAPNIAAEDPAAVAEADRKRQAAAKRQTQIDILQGQPGRGGTILTDKYNYNV